MALAKAKPDELAYGTAGSSIHLAVEQVSTVAGIRMNHIPYRGSAPAITDLVGGQIQVLFDPFSTLYPQVAAGKVRALAVTTEKRSSVAPDLPTLAESGYPGFDVSSWQGIVVPAGTPQPIIDKLNAVLVRILGEPGVKAQFAKQGAEFGFRHARGIRQLHRSRNHTLEKSGAGRRREAGVGASGLAAKTIEVFKHGSHQLAPACIFRRQARGEETEQIARLLRGFRPRRGRRCGELGFQLLLAPPQVAALASTSPSRRRRSVAFWAAIPRWLSRSTGLSVMSATTRWLRSWASSPGWSGFRRRRGRRPNRRSCCRA